VCLRFANLAVAIAIWIQFKSNVDRKLTHHAASEEHWDSNPSWFAFAFSNIISYLFPPTGELLNLLFLEKALLRGQEQIKAFRTNVGGEHMRHL